MNMMLVDIKASEDGDIVPVNQSSVGCADGEIFIHLLTDQVMMSLTFTEEEADRIRRRLQEAVYKLRNTRVDEDLVGIV